MLRRELRRLREAKGTKGKNAKGIKDAMPNNFGGGSVEGIPEELNQLGEAEKTTRKALEVAKKATDAAKEEREARVEEARTNRALKTKLSESERAVATLREQLEEVNLFNAKLLYVNKLMQNRDLTTRQQRAIVESLDAAKSVREAKLLYTSLTESLKSKSGTMTEGRILGSSSRSTRSASPTATLNESVEVDRWAILAGIKSGK
jgi:flagellar biosynthesis/type III secretory pathway chaperone